MKDLTTQGVELIDAAIREVLKDDSYVIKNYGITKRVVQIVQNGENPISYPAVVDHTNQTQAVIDDNYSLVTYHRINTSRVIDTDFSFGDGENDQTNEVSMTLVVWADLSRILRSENYIGERIQMLFPYNLRNTTSGVFSQVCEVDSVSYDSQALFNQEYSGIEYSIHPQHTLFSIDYTLTTHVDTSCLLACQPC